MSSRSGAAASGVTLLELKMRAQAEQEQQARLTHLHQSTLILVLHFLHTRGLSHSLTALQKECNVSLTRETAADNVDLLRLVGEWSDMEERKYGRKVKLTRKRADGEEGAAAGGGGEEAGREKDRGKRKARMSYLPPISGEVGAPSALPAAYRDGVSEGRREEREAAEEKTQLSRVGRRNGMKSAPTSSASSAAPTAAASPSVAEKGKKKANCAESTPLTADFSLAGTTALSTRTPAVSAEPVPLDGADSAGFSSLSSALPSMPRPIRTPPVFDGIYGEYASIIQRDILVASPTTQFTDIIGLHSAKQLLKEAVLLPCRFPHFFTGLLTPWKGVLLYGPPGTGKTLLARAVASECGTTFFNISSASITSKYRGDSEKLVRVLFELARHYAPSTIFIDEVDSLMSTRDSQAAGGTSGAGDSDASRRMKSELLIQLDGLAQSTAQVFVLCASNLPWELDQALLRRLEKRILVGLPGRRGRCELIERQLSDRAAGVQWGVLADRTRGWSGSDLVSLCKESAMRPVRRLMKQLMSRENETVAVDAEIVLEVVSQADVDAALACTRPSVGVRDLSRYDDWHREFGATVEVDGVMSEEAEELTASGDVVR